MKKRLKRSKRSKMRASRFLTFVLFWSVFIPSELAEEEQVLLDIYGLILGFRVKAELDLRSKV